MNGYSKIRVNSSPTANPRSKESPSLPFPSPTHVHGDHPKPTCTTQLGPPSSKIHGQFPWQEEGGAGGGGERFGVVLNRTNSSSSQRFRAAERGHGGLQAAVRRAFSMRKSFSVAEGYWRIHDTGDEDKVQEEQQQEVRPWRRKKGRIFRACKSLFSF